MLTEIVNHLWQSTLIAAAHRCARGDAARRTARTRATGSGGRRR